MVKLAISCPKALQAGPAKLNEAVSPVLVCLMERRVYPGVNEKTGVNVRAVAHTGASRHIETMRQVRSSLKQQIR